MRRIAVFTFVFLMLTALVGCGEKEEIQPEDYVRLGDYKGLSVTRIETPISDDVLEIQIQNMLKAYSTKEEINDRTDVRDGDVVNIDFVGRLDGKAFDGGSAEGYDLEIGSGTFIEGFEEGLIGAKVSDTVTLNLTFPNVYPNDPSLAGEEVEFTVTVNSISSQIVPELTDEFVKENSQGRYSSVEEMKTDLKEELQQTSDSYADSMMYSDLLSQAIANTEVIAEIPQSFIDEKCEEMVRTMKSNAAAYNVDYEVYLNSYLGMTEDEFKQTIEESSQEIAMQNLVIHAIANAEKIEVSSEELVNKLDEYVELYGFASRNELLKNMNEDDIKESMLIVKVQEMLADNAKITVKTE